MTTSRQHLCSWDNDYTEPNGRAYSIGWWIFRTYYTTGTDVQLTGSSITTITLHENASDPGKFYLGGCN